MPVVETVGGFIGIAVVSSVVARKIRAKKQQEKMNDLAKELWLRRRFTYGSPEVIPMTSTDGDFTYIHDAQAPTQINYYPGISATVTPNIIAPPTHLHHDRTHTTHSSSIPIANLPTLSTWEPDTYNVDEYRNNISRKYYENIELSVRNLPTPPSCILRQETPSAPAIHIADTPKRVCLEAPISTSSRQEPSAPVLEDIIQSNIDGSIIQNNEISTNFTNVDKNLREDSEESDGERSSMESFYSCTSTLLDYEDQ